MITEREIKSLEDIYPLTIIKMRYGGKYIIFNAEEDAGFVASAQGNEEVFYVIDEWLEENVSPCKYGIGNTIAGAFHDFQIRNNTGDGYVYLDQKTNKICYKSVEDS